LNSVFSVLGVGLGESGSGYNHTVNMVIIRELSAVLLLHAVGGECELRIVAVSESLGLPPNSFRSTKHFLPFGRI
jgi:hypothetical protein